MNKMTPKFCADIQCKPSAVPYYTCFQPMLGLKENANTGECSSLQRNDIKQKCITNITLKINPVPCDGILHLIVELAIYNFNLWTVDFFHITCSS